MTDSNLRIVIASDALDKAALVSAGVENVHCLPATGDRFAILRDEGFEPTDIVLAMPGNTEGDRMAGEFARRIGAEHCRRIQWPDGGDVTLTNAHDALSAHGDAVVRECIANAVPLPVAGLHSASDFEAQTLALYRSGRSRGLSTGWASVDRLMTIRPGELSVVTGYPGGGKSEFLDALAMNLAQRYRWKFCVASFENPPEEHLSKLAEKKVGLPFREGPSIRMNEVELKAALGWIGEHFHFIRPPEDDGATLDYVLTRCRIAVRRHGVSGLILDPWNYIEHQRAGNVSETEHVSAALTKIKRFAMHHGVHVWLVAHPAKPYRDNGRYPVPTLYDISGSAHFVNKADVGLVVHRERGDGIPRTDIHVRKVRFKAVGQTGVCSLRWDNVSGRYHDDIEAERREEQEADDGRAA